MFYELKLEKQWHEYKNCTYKFENILTNDWYIKESIMEINKIIFRPEVKTPCFS